MFISLTSIVNSDFATLHVLSCSVLKLFPVLEHYIKSGTFEEASRSIEHKSAT